MPIFQRIFGNDAKIDPKSFVEELSDNEEWSEVLDIVSAGGSGSATKEQQSSEGSVSPREDFHYFVFVCNFETARQPSSTKE